MRILVVDDEGEYGFLLFNLLARLGHDPVLAFDANDALDILADSSAGKVRGVITDIEMPGMNGVELAREIRARYEPAMPVAFCTGSDPSDETAQSAARLGPVLPKLSSLDDVSDVVTEMMATWRSRQP
jgi:two-component system sensor histidine kinase and response regulator WspE